MENKVTQEELAKMNELKQRETRLLIDLGYAESQVRTYTKRADEVYRLMEEYDAEKMELQKELIEKYGNHFDVNPETGEITYPENNTETQE